MLGNYINPLIQALESNGYLAWCEQNPRGLTLRILDHKLRRETSLGLDPLRLNAEAHHVLGDYCTAEQLDDIVGTTFARPAADRRAEVLTA